MTMWSARYAILDYSFLDYFELILRKWLITLFLVFFICKGWQQMGIMRRSNCSAPTPRGQPQGQRKNVCDKKGRGIWKKSD